MDLINLSKVASEAAIEAGKYLIEHKNSNMKVESDIGRDSRCRVVPATARGQPERLPSSSSPDAFSRQ